jgi:hypothetical protein
MLRMQSRTWRDVTVLDVCASSWHTERRGALMLKTLEARAYYSLRSFCAEHNEAVRATFAVETVPLEGLASHFTQPGQPTDRPPFSRHETGE